MRYVQPNLKIVGGVDALTHSWPSLAYIVFNYKSKLLVRKNVFKTFEFTSICDGNLIDRLTVLFTAHCIHTTFMGAYDDKKVKINIVPNEFYPTYGSMVTVYMGLQDLNDLSQPMNNETSFQKLQVSKLIIVI